MEIATKHPFDTLSPSQKDAAKVLEEYLLYGTVSLQEKDFVVLKGYAGTGKSYTLNKVIDSIRGLSVAMSAPTHKAVQVLRRNSENSAITFATIHSLLGLTQHISDTGKVTYVQDKSNTEPRIREVELLIVDEASMLDGSLFQTIMDYKGTEEGSALRLVFTGDPLQAPPVGEKQSLVFLEDSHVGYKVVTLELSEPMRQSKDNPILTYATAIRQNILKEVNYKQFLQCSETEGIEEIPQDEIIDSILPMFGQEFEQNPDYMKILAWTNESVNMFNSMTRRYRLRQPNPPKIVDGEYLVADKPIFIPTPMGFSLAINTSEEMKVVQVEQDKIRVQVNFFSTYSEMSNQVLSRIPESEKSNPKSYIENEIRLGRVMPCTDRSYEFVVYKAKVELKRLNGAGKEETIYKIINILHETSEKLYRDVLKHLETSAKGAYVKGKAWREFYKFQNYFAQVKYNYALTVHKSQGSSYDNCMVYMSDINKNRWMKGEVDTKIEERNRLKYVAVTRAKKKLFILP